VGSPSLLEEVQMKIELASIAAAAMLSVTTMAAQTQTPASAPAQPNAAGEKVTVTGCVERADQVTPAGSTAGTSVDSLDFVLMKAPDATSASAAGSATAKSEASATGTSGSAGMPLYRLQAETGKLNPHVGHKVEITGMRDAAGQSASQTPGAANATATGANAPHLRVESVKMLAESCRR